MIKKLIIYIILTILVLSGCASEKTVSQKYGEDVISFHGFELPAALGEPILTENKLKDISDSNRGEMIKTVADLLSYMKKTGNDSDSKSFSTLSCNILFGDYKEAGIVKIDFEDGSEYYEQYFCSDGKYYPINGYAQLTEKKKWMEDYSGDLWSFDKREEMIDAIKTGFPSNGKTVKGVYAIPLYLTSNNGEAFRVDYSSKKYPFYYYCEDVKIPVILGTPQLSEVDISALANNDDFDEVADVISTYPDLVAYKKLKNGDAPFDTDQPYKIAEVVMNMLCYDYDEVGRVIAHQDNNGYTYSYIKNGESFCLIDLFLEDRGVIGVFDSKEEFR